jgi:two-component system, OmpR family, phosphate regulon response regulator PhoB
VSTPTILVVDDNQDSRTILAAVFAYRGYEVIAQSDGDAALRIAREHAVSLVVSELYVSVGGTACLVEVLKRDRETAALPIMVITSRVMPGDCEHAREFGCDALLGKPFNLREVLDVADGLLSSRRPATSAPALGPSPLARPESGDPRAALG